MYRAHYPFFLTIWRTIRRIGLLLGLLLLFITFVEASWAGLLLYRINPVLGYTFVAITTLLALALIWRLLLWRHDRQTLVPPPRPTGTRVRQGDLEAYCAYLAHRMKRLSLNENLTREERLKIRQQAYNIEGLLGSHPLIDDLTRAITKAEQEALEPAFRLLDKHAEALGASKIRSVIEDAVKPPFPVVNSMVVIYHQITLITMIVDIYMSRATLREYAQVIKDVANSLGRAQIFRISQRLFEGVYANCPPLGRGVDDLGQAITCTWLTWTVTRAAAYRCRTLYPWQLGQAVEVLDRGAPEALIVLRDTLIADVLPMLKLRIRHSAPAGVADAANFSESVAQSVARAVDSVVLSLRSNNPERAIQRSRETLAGAHPHDDDQAPPLQASPKVWRKRGALGRWMDRVHHIRENRNLP